LVVVCAGCGRVGLDLLPAGRDDSSTEVDGGTDGSRDDGGNGLRDAGLGAVDVCVLGVCASDVDRCTSDREKTSPGICGCGAVDGADDDDDGTPDCIDLCPNAPDVLADGDCGCAAAAADDDGDGTANCHDLCPDDGDKTSPAICGCGLPDADRDDDGMADCADGCADDAEKVTPGLCGCGTDESSIDSDSDDDGDSDCLDTCGGADDTRFVPDASCGVGHCRSSNTPSSCADGVETACVPGAPLGSDDATCDGVDDDCDENSDENYAADASCGQGYCRDNNTASSCADGVEAACQPAAPLDVDDDTADGVDDDCDGAVDEDCPSAPAIFSTTGQHDISIPSGCGSVTVQLWGAGGASGGGGGYWGGATGGRGGPGGFTERSFSVSAATAFTLRIGQGGQSCGAAGSNVNASYSGGEGSTMRSGSGSPGADMTEAGGNGASPGSGGDGGRGYFGGGGGGGGAGPAWNPFGTAGGGGAASVLLVDATRLVAGGGGGGGGAGSTIASSGVSGGGGGSGCSGDGGSGGNEGGGGGGGGKCDGTNDQQGSAGDPYLPAGVTLPAGTAAGGATRGDCLPGGDGYAIVTWAP
jgi:hypothetical protein